MYWNYRVIKKLYGDRDSEGKIENPDSEYNEYFYGIHEVFYDENGKAAMCTVDPVNLSGETPSELIIDLVSMVEAFSKPILDFDSIPEDGCYNEIEERRNELLDENGNMRDVDELVEEGLLVEHDSVFEGIRDKLGMEEFDMKEYRNEQVVEQQKSEREFTNAFSGKSLPDILINCLEIYKNNPYTDYGKEEENDQ